MQCVCTPCHHLYCNAVAIRHASASNPIIAPPQFNGDWCGVAFISWFLTRHSLLHEFIKNGSGNSFSLHHPAFIGRPRRPDLPDQVKPLAIRHAYAEWGSWPAVAGSERGVHILSFMHRILLPNTMPSLPGPMCRTITIITGN